MGEGMRCGRLQLVLEDYAAPPADIYAVYPERHSLSAKVNAFVDFLEASFEGGSGKPSGKSVVW